MRLLAILMTLLASIAQAQTVTLPPGNYTTTVSPAGVTFVAVPPPCTWPPAPTVTPPCASGGNQSGGSWQHAACPAWAYVGGSCPVSPTWRALVSPAAFPIIPKPAKGVPWTTPYGTTQTRVTAHATEIPGSARFRNDYSRREPWNADGTRYVGDQSSGYWGLYDANSWAYLGRLNGPAGDAEIQWDATDPRILYYLPQNGGTVLRRLDVNTNTSTVQYDFTADVRAVLGAGVARCWTKSEGSPSRDGKLWGLLCQSNDFTKMFGYVVIDVQAKRIVWSRIDTVLPDHVSVSPSGRWLVRSGYNDGIGVVAYPLAGGTSFKIANVGEHSDIGVLPNGHDSYASVDYQTNDGDIYAVDLDAGPARKVFGHVYHDANNPNTFSVHFSYKGFGAPGWFVVSRYGAPVGPANISIVNMVTGVEYGIGLNYPVWANYFDEPHAVANRNMTRVAVNANHGTSQDIDVEVISLGALPQ